MRCYICDYCPDTPPSSYYDRGNNIENPRTIKEDKYNPLLFICSYCEMVSEKNKD